jgi:hypothetical protein
MGELALQLGAGTGEDQARIGLASAHGDFPLKQSCSGDC